jgi:hypothetical protein
MSHLSVVDKLICKIMKGKILFAFFIMMMTAVTETSAVEYPPAPGADGIVSIKQNGTSIAPAEETIPNDFIFSKNNNNTQIIYEND